MSVSWDLGESWADGVEIAWYIPKPKWSGTALRRYAAIFAHARRGTLPQALYGRTLARECCLRALCAPMFATQHTKRAAWPKFREHLQKGQTEMKDSIRIAQTGVVLALIMASSSCVVEPRNGYYDRDHHRYYHEHVWIDCTEHDEHCR
jgi:hypothetical protein